MGEENFKKQSATQVLKAIFCCCCLNSRKKFVKQIGENIWWIRIYLEDKLELLGAKSSFSTISSELSSLSIGVYCKDEDLRAPDFNSSTASKLSKVGILCFKIFFSTLSDCPSREKLTQKSRVKSWAIVNNL